MVASMNTPASQSHAPDTALEDIEVELFVRALKLRHGYDFSQYAPASLKRRVLQLVHAQHTGTVSGLTTRLLHEQDFLTTVLEGLSVPVSEMFRDPDVFRALREQVFPVLASYPQINIWQAGCAHGQEVYSLRAHPDLCHRLYRESAAARAGRHLSGQGGAAVVAQLPRRRRQPHAGGLLQRAL
jgi:hypothetical protein